MNEDPFYLAEERILVCNVHSVIFIYLQDSVVVNEMCNDVNACDNLFHIDLLLT
jgi:hypothetical protein